MKKMFLLGLCLTLIGAAFPVSAQMSFTAPLQASTTGTNPVDFEFRADGTLIAKGNAGVGSLLSSDQGAGTRMLWYPALGAFRAGKIQSNTSAWNLTNIGLGSVAFGLDTTASGAYATSFGVFSLASGALSFAACYGASATGNYSSAFDSFSTASGLASTAFNGGTASGYNSAAFGGSTASGDLSAAFGGGATASAYASFAIGMSNANVSSTGAAPNRTTWVATDPLFEIGNRSATDAVVVYKNGSSTFQGPVTGQGGFITTPASVAATDIPMYTGN